MMRKLFVLGLVVLAVAGAYWSWYGPAPSLPASHEIYSIELSTSAEKAFLVPADSPLQITNPEKIEAFMTQLSKANKRRQDSVSDTPYAKQYARIEITFKNGQSSSLAYLYPKGTQTYLEQPYVGIYQLEQPIETWLANLE